MKLSAIILLCVLAAVVGGLLVGAFMPASHDSTEILKQRKLYEAQITHLNQQIQQKEKSDKAWSKTVADLRDSLKAAHALVKQVQIKLTNVQKIDFSHASAPDLDSIVRVVVERAKSRHDH